ncbi:MAG: XrtA/PEP-CTERM system-associated ATPase [Stellaceae bacterium]
MYAKFYGLDSLAFQLTPDPRFFFESAEHRRAMAHLTFGLHNAEGFIVITGEVGAGKTMLVDCLLSQIDPHSFVTARIVTSQLGGDDLLRMVAAGFGLDHAGLAKATLLIRIQEYALAQFAAGRRALLIIDEAQNLSFEALEELRMLSNIVVGSAPALQSFLLGQPQFRQVLGNPALDQLRQRVTGAYHLGPLSEADTRGYIEHRLCCAGWKGDPQFTDDCFAPIYQHTGGVPRRINGLCSRLMLFGFIEGRHTISAADTQQVAADLRSELSAVATANRAPNGVGVSASVGDHPLPLAAICDRLGSLERMAEGHDRTIRRVIEIMAGYFERSESDELR